MIRKIDSNIFSLTILKVTTFSRIRHRDILSLNYLLADKIIVDKKCLDIKTREAKVTCTRYNNLDYFCTVFNKHISRYLENLESIEVVKI